MQTVKTLQKRQDHHKHGTPDPSHPAVDFLLSTLFSVLERIKSRAVVMVTPRATGLTSYLKLTVQIMNQPSLKYLKYLAPC